MSGNLQFCTSTPADTSNGCDLSPDLSTIPAGPPGVPGAAGGADGADGSDGAPAFSALTAAFTQPAVNGTVSVSIGTTAWMTANLPVFVASGGTYKVVSVTNATTAVLRNLGYTDNAAPAATVASGGLVVPTGLQGSSAGSSDQVLEAITTESDLGDLLVTLDQVGALRFFYNSTSGQGEWWRLEDTEAWYDAGFDESTVSGQTILVFDWDIDDKRIGWRRI